MTEEPQEATRRNAIDRALGGWQPARVLMAANHLGFFAALGQGPLSAAEVASKCSAHPRSTALLLNACVALGLLEKEGGSYRNSSDAQASLVPGGPGYIGDAIAHQEDLWQAWGRLPDAVRDNRRVVTRQAEGDAAASHRNFILAMHNRAMRAAPVLAEHLDLSDRRQLFDAGGGPGTFSIFLVRRYPGLRAIIFDLPQTIAITREIVGASEVADRISFQPGNYFEDGFGDGNDVVLLSAILHSMGPERSLMLLRKAYDSLVAGGMVVVNEGLVNADGTGPLSAVLFSLNMLVNTGEGQSYSEEELSGLMADAGFADTTTIRLPERVGTALVIGVKP